MHQILESIKHEPWLAGPFFKTPKTLPFTVIMYQRWPDEFAIHNIAITNYGPNLPESWVPEFALSEGDYFNYGHNIAFSASGMLERWRERVLKSYVNTNLACVADCVGSDSVSRVGEVSVALSVGDFILAYNEDHHLRRLFFQGK